MAKVSGLDNLKKNFRRAKTRMRENEEAGIIKAGLVVKKSSQQNVPVRQGNLRSSAFIVLPDGVKDQDADFTGDNAGGLKTAHSKSTTTVQAETAARTSKNKLTGAVAYSAPYAISVHENPRAGAAGYDPSKDLPSLKASRVHSKVGGWKFLEDALKSSLTGMFKAIQKELRFD